MGLSNKIPFLSFPFRKSPDKGGSFKNEWHINKYIERVYLRHEWTFSVHFMIYQSPLKKKDIISISKIEWIEYFGKMAVTLNKLDWNC